MKTLQTCLFCTVFFALIGCGSNADNLEQAFKSPPDSARTHVWWHWMNGNVTKEGITKDLEAMKAAGLGGCQAFHISSSIPEGPVKYDSKAWHELMAHAISEADRLGLEICIHNGAGWSNTGGPWITPEHSMQEVVTTEQTVKGGQKLSINLKQPTIREYFYRDIAVLAFPAPINKKGRPSNFRIDNWPCKAGATRMRLRRSNHFAPDTRKPYPKEIIESDSIIDLTRRMDKSGKLTWDAPDGDWTIVRIGYTTTGKTNHPAPPEGCGLECDKLSKAGADLHWNNIIKRVLADAGPRAGKAFNNILIDSYEVRHQNWTSGFEKEFRKRRGYDIIKWLPCMTGRVIGSVEQSERFLWDLRRTIADLMMENYFGHFAVLCHENGLMFSLEPYGNGNFDSFQAATTADIPMGEFWIGKPNAWHAWSPRLAASAAHIEGKKYVGAESFTAGRQNAAFINHPYSMKTQGDFYFASGINRYIFHTFVHQPWPDQLLPGMTMGPWGMQMNRNNTWFLHARDWFDHLARCQYLLQSGRQYADLLYIYGEQAPCTPQHREEIAPIPPHGYDYDASGFETLMKLSVKDGELVLPSGMKYRVLVLTRMDRVRPETLEKIRELAKAGATIVGSRPTASPSLENYPECDKRVEALAAELWNKQIVHSPDQLDSVLAKLNLPADFQVPEEANAVYLHRQTSDTDVYFVANQMQEQQNINCLFRVGGRVPELWHPETGRIERAPVWEPVGEDRTAVTLGLSPAGSVFVVFRQSSEKADPIVKAVFTPRDKQPEPERKEEVSIEIVSAWYGHPKDKNKRVDATKIIAKLVKNGSLSVAADNSIFGDPAENVVKTMVAEYKLDGKPATARIQEGDTLKLGAAEEEVFPAYDPSLEMRTVDGKEIALVYKPGTLDLRRASGKSKEVKVVDICKPIELSNPWTVTFGPMGPEKPVKLDKLVPWNKHDNELIKHFSGAATYRTTFNIGNSKLETGNFMAKLDLGNVQVMARVKVNGKDLGLLWKPPYAVDVSDVVKQGENQLEVTVINLFANRLIGDEQYPDTDERGNRPQPDKIPDWLLKGEPRPKTERKTFAIVKHWRADSKLLPSGLIGPVRILTAKVVEGM